MSDTMPQKPPLPAVAVGVIAFAAAAKIALHLWAINQYGYFRDELYYIASTKHLAWGYVDHPPLSIAVLAVVRALLGDSLVAVRLVPLLAGVASLIVTALMARRLGGGRFAQGLTAAAFLLAPVFLGADHVYSMNAIDILAWALAGLVLLRALDSGSTGDWLGLGVVVGLGLLNKISVLWFCGGLAAGLLLTPYRRALRSPGPWMAGAVALVLFAPHLIWQARNAWPTLEFMHNATTYKMTPTSPASFLKAQVLDMNPGAAPVWIGGLLFGLIGQRGRPGQVLAWIYLSVLAVLLAEGHSRVSYLSVAYPMLLALGGVGIERLSRRGSWRWLRPASTALVVLFGAVAIPMALPVLPVRTFVRYQAALGLAPRAEERSRLGALPQHYADMFGWEQMTELVAKAYNRLTPEEKRHCRVYGHNYGEAGAIDVLGARYHLPPAICGHNSYWLWGPGSDEPDVLIVIGGDRKTTAAFFEQVEIVGQTSSPWSMPYERGLDVTIGRKPRMSIWEAWPQLKNYI